MAARSTHRNPPPPDVPGSAAEAPAGNRAERRARGKARPPAPDGTGKVHGVGSGHAPDPRQYAAHRRG
jgi:hypothetical protein